MRVILTIGRACILIAFLCAIRDYLEWKWLSNSVIIYTFLIYLFLDILGSIIKFIKD